MVKAGLPVRGKRVVIAGSGPLLLAVASCLRQHGAEIPLICEQAPWERLARFAAALIRYPKKIVQGFTLRKDILESRALANRKRFTAITWHAAFILFPTQSWRFCWDAGYEMATCKSTTSSRRR